MQASPLGLNSSVPFYIPLLSKKVPFHIPHTKNGILYVYVESVVEHCIPETSCNDNVKTKEASGLKTVRPLLTH